MLHHSILKYLTSAVALLDSVQAAPLDLDAYGLHVDLAGLMLTRRRSLEKRASFTYGKANKVRGVNLGGWFVLEPWITPSIFSSDSIVDEYTYTKSLGKEQASSQLTNHWKSWITQADFSVIAGAGLNHVRIPIGYWALISRNEDPYVQGQLPILDQAIQWARGAGLKVMLDLHGAPESQNGFDNSGKYGPVGWQSGSSVQQTLDALSKLADRYKGDTDVVTSIELLNEPLGTSLDLNGVKDFYSQGISTVRSKSQNYAISISDAFQDFSSYWNGQYVNQNVILDTHQYQIFSPEQVSQSPASHISAACALGPKLAGLDKPGVVGEWTGAQTDCAKYLNGRNKGARYDGTFTGPQGGSNYVGDCKGKDTGTVAGLSSDDKSNIRAFVEAQLDAYEQGAGWVFWTWKTESAPEWSMKDLIAGGLFPQPLDNRQHPGQCG